MRSRFRVSACNAGAALLLGCGSGGGARERPADSGNLPDDPGSAVQVELDTAEYTALARALTLDEAETGASLAERYRVPFSAELGYDPLAAPGLERIVGSVLGSPSGAPEQEALAAIGRAGFSVGMARAMPSFPYGYSWIYAEHLPVFISADMVLEAVHRSYDEILVALEREVLVPRVRGLLDGMASRLEGGALADDPELAGDTHFFLSVARALLGTVPKGAFGSEVEAVVDAALAAEGERRMTLFGIPRDVDLSQFRPRGHYAGDAALEDYFRAMIWLGRTDLRLLETLPDGAQVLRRRQLEVAYGLRELLDADSFASWQSIDRAIGAFVGEHDDMTLAELAALSADLGVSGRAELAALDDTRIARALIAGGYGAQRIASQVMRRREGADTLPLGASFALFGQRYTVDSHVFSSVVYDRAPDRVVPDPLDVAFGALGNDHAVSLLADELEAHDYAPQLAQVRTLVDAHPANYWQGSLYTSWLGALRGLSPGPELGDASSGLPSIARTELWGRRLLNTQLASWSQLRRDSVLYVKQSYTSDLACEFPDAYVDPYPQFFFGVASFAEQGRALAEALDWGGAGLGGRVSSYFEALGRISTILGEMAESQRAGTPFDAEQLAFINQAINVNLNCDGTVLGHEGWYSELYFDRMQAVELDPTIADVHTDIGGDLPVARPPSVLHAGTGLPRPIVLTVDSCSGPRAYAGFVYAYHELLAEGLVRLTDEDWKERLNGATPPPDPAWMAPILTR